MDIVMLAAGLSSRMEGENKMLLPYDKTTIVDHSCLQALEFLASYSEEHQEESRLILVTGHMADKVKDSVERSLEFASRYSLIEMDIIHNKDYLKGQFSSVQKGISRLSGKGPFFISLADMPLVGKDNYQKLVPILKDHDAVRPFAKKEDGSLEPGHPVLISQNLVPLIEKQPVESSMHEILKSCNVIKPLFEDISWTYDIDFRQDYKRITSLLQP